MRTDQVILATLLLLSPTLHIAASDAKTPQPSYYCIEAKLIETSPNGQEKILCCPRLMTIEGQRAEIRIGDNLKPPKGIETEKEPVFIGTSCEFNVSRNDDRLSLKAHIRHSKDKSNADGICIALTEVVSSNAVTLDKKITQTVNENLRVELLVREWNPTESKEAATDEASRKVRDAAKTPAAIADSPLAE